LLLVDSNFKLIIIFIKAKKLKSTLWLM
jgi:hypothetical protein